MTPLDRPPTRSNAQQLSDAAVLKATGASREHWFTLLDGRGATGWTHKDIAAHLVEEYGMGGWWAQGITVAYEQARGMRLPGQRADGTFEASVSKQIRAPLPAVYAALTAPDQRAGWLDDALAASHPGVVVEALGATENRSVRWRWVERKEGEEAVGTVGRRIVVTLDSRASDAVRVTITHTNLPDGERVPELKQLWRDRLTALAEQLA